MWAIVKIQRAFRKYRLRGEARQENKKKISNTRERWRRQAGDVLPEPSPSPPPPPRQSKKSSRNKQQEEDEEYRNKRRTDFMEDVSEDNDYVQKFYEKQNNSVNGGIFR